MTDESLCDVEISAQGIGYLVNNDWDECEKLFKKHKFDKISNDHKTSVFIRLQVLVFDATVKEKAL